MPILKGNITGPSKTRLGEDRKQTRGENIRTSSERHTGRNKKYYAILANVLSKNMDGETVLFPFATVKLLVKTGKRTSIIEWPHWLRITNSPDEIDTVYGGLQNISEAHPLVTVEFTGKARRKGTVTLGTVSGEADDYSGGEIKECDGVMIV